MPAWDLPSAQWRKSSYSGNNGACVEVAGLSGRIAVRDSKNPNGDVLIVDAAAWLRLLAAAKR